MNLMRYLIITVIALKEKSRRLFQGFGHGKTNMIMMRENVNKNYC